MTLANQSTLFAHLQKKMNSDMNKNNKDSTEAPETPRVNKRPFPNELEEEEHRIPRPPTVSPVRTGKGKIVRDNMELDKEATDAKMLEAAEGAKMMDGVSVNITNENKALDATIAADKEEAQKVKEQATENEAMTKRIRDMTSGGGKRSDEVVQKDKDGGSDDDVANSVWAKKMGQQQQIKGRRNKKLSQAPSPSMRQSYLLRQRSPPACHHSKA